ncbi:hypothetical protein [Nonomuraea candida]|uniref:hypothetical protein n=1 Tax=Nonomuraea candida TaxID=359159 RepID=UPI0005B7D943|nr:hypothetical protein [Nonomuraea candida]
MDEDHEEWEDWETPADPRDPGDTFLPEEAVYHSDAGGSRRERFAGLPVMRPRRRALPGVAVDLAEGQPLHSEEPYVAVSE